MTVSRDELECRVLRALCQASQASLRDAARRLLKDYRWTSAARRLVFECVLELPTHDAAILRTELPARLTRRGFPDVAWEEFFQPPIPSPEEAERWIRELAGSTPHD